MTTFAQATDEAVARRRAYAERNDLRPMTCRVCGVERSGWRFVKWTAANTRYVVLRTCDDCRADAPGAVARGADFFRAAEKTLYPAIPYARLTPLQRRHTYWLARTWWLATDLPESLMEFDRERATVALATLETFLSDHGLPLHPVPPCPCVSR